MTFALPGAGDVHVWRIFLDKEILPFLLTADEQARADRFHLERDARRWAACRSRLRRILGAYLGTSPQALEFETNSWGKPGLKDCPLRFNVSHSGGVALLAFAWQQEVGVDIEQRRGDFAPEELAAEVFSAAEQVVLCDCPPKERHELFLTLWTAKEASVKALGEGLSFPLPALTLTPILQAGHFDVQGLSVCRLEAGPDHLAALALSGSLAFVQYFTSAYDCMSVPGD